MLRLDDIDFDSKVALVRSDLNVPMDGGKITDDTRIASSLPTLLKIISDNGSAVVMSHLGRPKEGETDANKSLSPVAKRLSEHIGKPVKLSTLDEAQRPGIGEIVLLENTRFNVGEKANDAKLAARYATLGDVFVMDAFASAHRKEASTAAIADACGQKCAGSLLSKEINALAKAMEKPSRPLVAIAGGAKVSGKIEVLASLAKIADRIAVGGGLANTFLLAMGHSVGKSLAESALVDTCKAMLDENPGKFLLPTDLVVVPSIDSSDASVKACDGIGEEDVIGDLGPDSVAAINALVAEAGTVIWNGALGVFENEALSSGTRSLAKAIAKSHAFSLAGGGETLAAANQYGVSEDISWLSTGGGAFLEFIEGKTLPGIAAIS